MVATLETGGEDVKLHSKRVGKMWNYTRNEWGRCEITLETSGKIGRAHLKEPTEYLMKETDENIEPIFGWTFTSFPLVSSVVLHLLHSFRV
jgi:hypothetical protein